MGGKVGFMGLVNYKDHPTDTRYVVFNFNSIEEANYFEELITILILGPFVNALVVGVPSFSF